MILKKRFQNILEKIHYRVFLYANTVATVICTFWLYFITFEIQYNNMGKCSIALQKVIVLLRTCTVVEYQEQVCIQKQQLVLPKCSVFKTNKQTHKKGERCVVVSP